MPTVARVKKNSEFKKIFTQGKYVATKALVLYLLPNGSAENRIGFVASKKIGNAVTRNHVKRLLKESCRLYESMLKTGFDMVIIARPLMTAYDYAQTAAEMKIVFRRGGLF